MVDLRGDVFFWLKDIETELAGLLDQYIGIVDNGSLPKNDEAPGHPTLCFVEADQVKAKLPKADLVSCRDVLITSSFDDLLDTLERIRKSGAVYLLAATYTDDAINKDKRTGQRRTINLFKYPFNLPKPKYLIADRFEPEISFGLWNTADLPYLRIRTNLQLIKLKRKLRAELNGNRNQ
jgi:hypothetical protein